MKVSCPHCPATYNIPDEKVPSKVKKVKCKKCGGVMVIMPLKKSVNTDVSKPVAEMNDPMRTDFGVKGTKSISVNNESQNKGFSWLSLFFAPYYYAGYGKFRKGLVFALIGFTPITSIIINIYAGFKAKKELPIGQQPFKRYIASTMGPCKYNCVTTIFGF